VTPCVLEVALYLFFPTVMDKKKDLRLSFFSSFGVGTHRAWSFFSPPFSLLSSTPCGLRRCSSDNVLLVLFLLGPGQEDVTRLAFFPPLPTSPRG